MGKKEAHKKKQSEIEYIRLRFNAIVDPFSTLRYYNIFLPVDVGTFAMNRRTTLEPKKTRNPKNSLTFFFEIVHVTSPPQTHNTGRPSKMAKSLPYGIVPHGFYWPLLGQKSSYKKFY
jgi:hypothetical protein